VPTTDIPRTGDELFTCAARGSSDKKEEAVRYAIVDVQGMRVTRNGVNLQPAYNSNAEKVLYALNMLFVCVFPNPYGSSTHHVQIPKFVPRFLQVESTQVELLWFSLSLYFNTSAQESI